MNKLYFGDNLEILREYIADESIDLIYLDPPFNSQAQYNVVFPTPYQAGHSAQAGAFRGTWSWGEESEKSYTETMRIGGNAARMLGALRTVMGETNMMAYLVMMAVRMTEMHRVLKRTGSIYLHCDPVASHYLKILLDSVFGSNRFRSEIVWKRTSAHSNTGSSYGDVTDTILYFSKDGRPVWNKPSVPLSARNIETKYTYIESDGRRYATRDLRNPGVRPNLHYEYKGYKPHPNGWSISREKMEEYDRQGRLYFPKDKDGRIRLKLYLDDVAGQPMQNLWDDIAPLNSQAQERLGYPTQKPIALLERIISASSNEGDIVFDPFCGCGTTIEAAERLRRQWIGVDIAVHAIKVIEARLSKRVGDVAYDEIGLPRDFASAVALAERDKYQFQWWANYLFNPHALREHGKKGADRGIDGELFFPNGPGRPWGRMLTSVKGGERVGPAMVREFARVLERENAQMGLFVCLRSPTREMTREAVSVGFADVVHGQIPKLQIVALEEWFAGWRPKLPPLEHLPSAAFAAKRKTARKPSDLLQPQLPFTFTGGKEEKEVIRHFNLRMVEGAA